MTPKAAKEKIEKEYFLTPECKSFDWMPGDDLARLARDIKDNGLYNPIICNGESKVSNEPLGPIVDGKNRLAACLLADVAPIFWGMDLDTPLKLFQYSYSVNVERRQLSKDQLAIYAAERESFYKAEAKKAMSEGGKKAGQGGARTSSTLSRGPRSIEKAAADVGVSAVKARRAKSLLIKDPAKAEEVKQGGKSIRQAEKEIQSEKASDKPESDKKSKGWIELRDTVLFPAVKAARIQFKKVNELRKRTNYPDGLAAALDEYEKALEKIESWKPENLKPCGKCNATGKVNSPGGVEIRCEWCGMTGQAGA